LILRWLSCAKHELSKMAPFSISVTPSPTFSHPHSSLLLSFIFPTYLSIYPKSSTRPSKAGMHASRRFFPHHFPSVISFCLSRPSYRGTRSRSYIIPSGVYRNKNGEMGNRRTQNMVRFWRKI
jgi:hypothetical protein